MNRRYIIIEDEQLAYEELKRMMTLIRPNYTLTGWAQGVEQAVMLLRGGNFDLILLDIQLSDGLCFEIFEQCPSDVAVIFTTAYDEYALKAFKLNSVDYLLKPIDEGELNAALEKYERHSTNSATTFDSSKLESSYLSGNGKSRFLVQVGDTFRHVQTEDVAYFYSEDKYVFLHLFTGKRYIIN
jgi:two-component system response regulator LytT